jgi:hypothetical protein
MKRIKYANLSFFFAKLNQSVEVLWPDENEPHKTFEEKKHKQ